MGEVGALRTAVRGVGGGCGGACSWGGMGGRAPSPRSYWPSVPPAPTRAQLSRKPPVWAQGPGWRPVPPRFSLLRVSLLPQPSEQAGCPGGAVNTLLRPFLRALPLERPHPGRAAGGGSLSSHSAAAPGSGRGGAGLGAVPPRALSVLVLLSMLHSFYHPLPLLFVVGWVLNYKF